MTREARIATSNRPAGFAADARHFKTTKGMASHQCAGDRAVEIQIADQEFLFGTFHVIGGAREESTGQGEGVSLAICRAALKSGARITAKTGPKISS